MSKLATAQRTHGFTESVIRVSSRTEATDVRRVMSAMAEATSTRCFRSGFGCHDQRILLRRSAWRARDMVGRAAHHVRPSVPAQKRRPQGVATIGPGTWALGVSVARLMQEMGVAGGGAASAVQEGGPDRRGVLVPWVFDYYTKLDFSPAHTIHKNHALRMVSARSALSSFFCYRGLVEDVRHCQRGGAVSQLVSAHTTGSRGVRLRRSPL